MIKVKIMFASWIELLEFKLVLGRNVIKTLITKRSLTCLCTESEIELAINAYHAKVEEIR